MRLGKIAMAMLILGLCAFASANAYSLTATVTTDGASSSAGGHLDIHCRQPGTLPWGTCASSISSGTEVRIDAVTHDGYWFMWFTTNPYYLPGCTTLWGGWGYGPNPNTVCQFSMPSSNASVNAEFQVP